MKLNLKRAIATLAGLAAAVSIVPILAAPAALAAPTPSGTAAVSPASGTKTTSYTVTPPSGATCPGDSANDGWRVTSYVVPLTVDPATLVFDSNGPTPAAFGTPQSSFRQPLYDTTGSPYVSGQTAAAATPPGPGPIVNVPAFSFGVYGDQGTGFEIPPGEYNVGIACILPVPGGAAIDKFWNNTITITAPTPSTLAWSVGTRPPPPNPVSAVAGNQECVVTFADDPANTSYTATANPGGATATGTGSPLSITGLTNNTAYSITVTATNAQGTSDPSTPASCTPSAGPRTNVTGVDVTPGAPGSGQATVSWVEPGPNSPAATPTGCQVVVTGPTPSTATVPCADETLLLTGLAEGSYSVTVTAQYADAPTTGSPAAGDSFTVNPAQVLIQNIDVNRPTGALVLTQVCGSHGLIPAVANGAVPGFPNGLAQVPAVAESLVGAPTAGGTAPQANVGPDGIAGNADDALVPDPNRGEYPYPTDANGVPNPNYPTYCGLDLGIAQFVTRGAGAGQFFAAHGVLDQVTVTDTRDDDTGWVVTGTMSDFSANGGTDSFSGSQLGWIPKPTVDGQTDTGPFTDSLGNTYNQAVLPGASVAPNSPAAGVADPNPATPENEALGLSSGRTLAAAPAANTAAGVTSGGLGTAMLDARLVLLIPVTADAGDYTGALTITAS